MAKTITFEYEGKPYILEYTRATAKAMSKAGLSLEKIEEDGINMLDMLFQGAFLAHHRGLKAKEIEDIFKHIKRKKEMWETLVEMYQAPSEALFEEPEEDEKNFDWAAN